MKNKQLKELLEKQHYGFAGEHTAVKICEWTKKSLRNEDVCFKEKFYGIRSHLCCQMSPAVNFCSHSCLFCWRPTEYNQGMEMKLEDKPGDIIDNCIKARRKLLNGFWGNKKADRKKLKEAENPNFFAISLSGEPTLYPKLPELVDGLKKRKITSFLVTNGTNPSMLKRLTGHQPTQLYITLPAPDKQTYTKLCKPLIEDGWEKIKQSLSLLKKFKRSTIRLTLVKGINMLKPEKYAELIKRYSPLFVEVKSYMYVGYSQKRLKIGNMPVHDEVKDFAKKIAEHSGYKIVDEKENSRVVLLMRKDSKARFL
ncbi:4-demethylwyosine synthase TYW1 [Candidatus Woesearchaeota archaeon]|nr:4-demethylwyosine synthase TYW1 [Candidatus Woesearchaeota archaeon]